MRTFEELCERIDAFLKSVTGEELALMLMKYGAKFEKDYRYKISVGDKIREYKTFKGAAQAVKSLQGQGKEVKLMNFKL